MDYYNFINIQFRIFSIFFLEFPSMIWYNLKFSSIFSKFYTRIDFWREAPQVTWPHFLTFNWITRLRIVGIQSSKMFLDVISWEEYEKNNHEIISIGLRPWWCRICWKCDFFRDGFFPNVSPPWIFTTMQSDIYHSTAECLYYKPIESFVQFRPSKFL